MVEVLVIGLSISKNSKKPDLTHRLELAGDICFQTIFHKERLLLSLENPRWSEFKVVMKRRA